MMQLKEARNQFDLTRKEIFAKTDKLLKNNRSSIQQHKLMIDECSN